MDDLLWHGDISLWSGGGEGDDGCEQSFFISDDPNRCSSPPLQELQTVAKILGLPAPDMSTVELATMDPNWLAGATSGELLLLEGLENDKGTAPGGGFWDLFENQKPKQQNPMIEKPPSSANNNGFQHPAASSPSASSTTNHEAEAADREVVARMKAIIYHAATFRPVNLGLETVEKKKRKNVKTSKEPQTVAARKRREKISEKIRVLQRLVPGGSKMDTASMLDEAASYLKFLRAQIKALEGLSRKLGYVDCLPTCTSFSFNSTTFPTNAYFPL